MTETISSTHSDAPPAGEAAHAVPPAKSIPFTEVPLVDFQGFRNGTDADKTRGRLRRRARLLHPAR